MTDEETPDDPEEELEQEQSEEEPEDDGEQPEIEADEMADLSAVADQVDAETTPEQENEDESDTDEVTEPGDLTDDTVTIGRVYCNLLGMGAAVAQDELGSGLEKDRTDALEEYADVARELEIDQAVDDWMAQHGGPDALTPGQTIIAMTGMWAAIVVMDDPEILSGIGGGTDE